MVYKMPMPPMKRTISERIAWRYEPVVPTTPKMAWRRLLGAATAHIGRSGTELAQTDRDDIEWAIATIRRKLDEAAWQAAWAEGRTMTLEQAIAYALEETQDA